MMRLLVCLGLLPLVLAFRPPCIADADAPPYTAPPPTLSAEQALARAAAFLRKVGWTPANAQATIALLPDAGDWRITYPATDRHGDADTFIRLDGRTHVVCLARSRQARKALHPVERATITPEAALALADQYVKYAGGTLDGLRLTQNEAVLDERTGRVTSWTVRFQQACQGYDIFAGGATITLHPLDGSLLELEVRILTPELTTLQVRVSQHRAEVIAVKYLRARHRNIRDVHVKSAQMYIVPVHMLVEQTPPTYRLAWMLNFTWNEDHWANAVVDAHNGKVLFHNNCL